MMKLIFTLVLVAVLTAVIAPMAIAAIEIPRECAWAGYSPAWLSICLIEIIWQITTTPDEFYDLWSSLRS